MALRVRVCSLAEVVPDDVRAFPVRGVTWPVIVTKIDDRVIATAGVCPHEDVSLAAAGIDGNLLVCSAHGYGFDLTTGKCRHDPSLTLRRYAVTIVGDEVWVDLL